MHITIVVKQVYKYISQVSGERLQVLLSRHCRERQTEIIKCGLTVILVISHFGFHTFSKLCPCQLGLDWCFGFTVIKLK